MSVCLATHTGWRSILLRNIIFIDLKGGIISGSYFSADFDSEIGDSSRIWNLILVYCILLGLILCNLRDPTCDNDQHDNVVAGDTIGH